MTSTCEMCDRPTGDTAFVCAHCTDRARRALHTVIELADDVETTVARLARYSDRHTRPAPVEPDEEVRAVGGLKVTPLPYDPGARDRWTLAAGAVVRWARFVTSERGGGPLKPAVMIGPLCGSGLSCPHSSCQRIRHRAVTNPVVRAAAWLSGALEWIRHRQEAVEIFTDLESAARTIVAIVDSPPPLEYAGPCYAWPEDGGEQCPEDLYAIKGAPWVRCPVCRTQHPMAGRREWLLREAAGVLANATDCARALTSLGQRVTESSVRNLAARGRIVAHGRDERGRPLYRVGEVRAVVDEIARRQTRVAA